MISTSGITGTGLKKCMPITLSCLFVLAAMLVMEMEEVLVARMADWGDNKSSSTKISFLSLAFSVAASTTSSVFFTASENEVHMVIFFSVFSFTSGVIVPLLTMRSRFLEMVAKALLRASSET